MKAYEERFLLHLVKTGAIKFGEFRLKSGRISPYFINLADAMKTGEDAIEVADAFVAKIMEIGTDFDYIHGAAYKGIPLAALIAARLSELHNINVRWGYDRKEKKEHGVPSEEVIVGDLRDNDTVLIVDDVITTGMTKIEIWEKLRVKRVRPKGIVVAVDREELSDADKEMLKNKRLNIFPILRITQIFDFLLNKEINGRIYVNEQIRKRLEEYLRRYGEKK
ncbi:MAG: Orotate phosphoribosyltransferase [Methanophagales archaeon]|nr:orotate phosphoribosyltransferase [Methanophagales archaeon]MCU4139160.1 Orotate phosphoribosyltransferase [Methanophagales archaeon]